MKIDIYNTDKKYDIIYADPPWSYNDKRGHTAKWGAIPYPTMDIEQIRNLPVSKLAGKNSVLFFWVTMPLLNKAFDIIHSWGYTYKTCGFCWVKQNPKSEGIYSGMGHWTNGNAELCLLATKGKPQRICKSVKQIVFAHRTRHSEKPNEVRERIVQLLGDIPRIELFARQQADGWDCWGNEV